MSSPDEPSSHALQSQAVATDRVADPTSAIDVPVQLRAVLATLLSSHEATQQSATTQWERCHAVTALRRAGIEYNDLRWLIRRGLVGHAVATPSANGTRAFQRQASLRFTGNSRIALSSAGVMVAREVIKNGALGASQVPGLAEVALRRSVPGPQVSGRSPNWNPHRGELRLGNLVVKRLTLVTADEEVILATFEELAWPERIDVPLHAHSNEAARLRLRKSVQALNRQPRELIRFQEEECTGGVRWELTHGDSPCGA